MTATAQAIAMTRLAASASARKSGKDMLAFDVSQQVAITDVFLIVSVSNERQAKAVVDAIEEDMLAAGYRTIRREGHRENRWILMDYGDVVVHIQLDEVREVYSLERLWRDCPAVELDLAAEPRTSA